jgi:hypothetical protein
MTVSWCDATAHAEMIAIKEAGRSKHDWHLNGATLVCNHGTLSHVLWRNLKQPYQAGGFWLP